MILSDDRCIITKHLHSTLKTIYKIPNRAGNSWFRLRL